MSVIIEECRAIMDDLRVPDYAGAVLRQAADRIEELEAALALRAAHGRPIRQLIAVPATDLSRFCLFAVCEDGTGWQQIDRGWEPLEPIPV